MGPLDPPPPGGGSGYNCSWYCAFASEGRYDDQAEDQGLPAERSLPAIPLGSGVHAGWASALAGGTGRGGVPMIQKKICMLGASAVGKTSLVRRYVYSVFSDRYLTTIGVKIDRKPLSLEGRELDLILWDIQGEDEFARFLPSYVRGASGCLIVADGTRRHTVETALELFERVLDTLGDTGLPTLFLLNKSDLETEWEIQSRDMELLGSRGWTPIETSAKLGSGVEEAFVELAQRMCGP